MSKYLIEVPHAPEKEACEQAARIFLNSGSHFISNADWGCMDGEHKAWIIIEMDEKHEARNILPPEYRRSAKVIELTRFSLEDLDHHKEAHA